ncbi:MAG: protein-(glutamine-N5) methyltransferase, release factor-specific [Betaproteobacteria bacterium RBG_16_64_18]|nr:MAG: protein-(glutamine-N5) methyltransferase, release factor-specific [Betaproteobacteria bacterium RBG_16_64_18]
MTCVDELIARSALSLTEARVLLAHALRVERAWIIAHGPDGVADAQAQAVEALFARRRAGEPIAYITGEREFQGLSLHVTQNVLIPRPETELVVEQALTLMAGRRTPKVLDLGTGSGAIAVAIANARRDAQVCATDASATALAVASGNASRHAVAVRFVQGDWFIALAGERFDLIASNPPYVADGDPHLGEGDLRFEPQVALLGGPDGMGCIRTIAAAARRHLAPGGWLVFEHGYDQGPACVRLLVGLGYTGVADIQDLSGLPRVCKGQFDAPPRPG